MLFLSIWGFVIGIDTNGINGVVITVVSAWSMGRTARELNDIEERQEKNKN